MRENGLAVGLVQGREDLFREREDVVWDLARCVRERGRVLGREVVGGTVDPERAELPRYFGFRTFLVGALGELFELGFGRLGRTVHGHSGGAGHRARGRDGADGWVVFRLLVFVSLQILYLKGNREPMP